VYGTDWERKEVLDEMKSVVAGCRAGHNHRNCSDWVFYSTKVYLKFCSNLGNLLFTFFINKNKLILILI